MVSGEKKNSGDSNMITECFRAPIVVRCLINEAGLFQINLYPNLPFCSNGQRSWILLPFSWILHHIFFLCIHHYRYSSYIPLWCPIMILRGSTALLFNVPHLHWIRERFFTQPLCILSDVVGILAQLYDKRSQVCENVVCWYSITKEVVLKKDMERDICKYNIVHDFWILRMVFDSWQILAQQYF